MRILVIHPGAIGDFVLSLPVLGALRDSFPDSFVEIIGSLDVVRLAGERYYADRVSSIDRGEVASLFVRNGEPSPSFVSFLSSFNLIISYLSDPEGIVAENLHTYRRGSVIIDTPISRKATIHRTEVFADTIRALGILVRDPIPRLFLRPDDRERGLCFFQERGYDPRIRPILALHPGSGGREKRWSASGFAEVADWAYERMGLPPLIIEGPAEPGIGEWIADRIRFPRPLIAAGLSPVELAGVLSWCHAFVGNDSGITHMAAALSLPTLALFGPTDPSLWGPRGDCVKILRAGAACPESGCSEEICLHSLSVEQVCACLPRILSSTKDQCRG